LAIILLKEFRRKDKLRKGKSKRVKALTSKREEAIFIEEEDGWLLDSEKANFPTGWKKFLALSRITSVVKEVGDPILLGKRLVKLRRQLNKEKWHLLPW
jgi:hypothetical protein